MKRYLLFGFDCYYPSGGWHDFMESFDSPMEALQYKMTLKYPYTRDDYQIVDGQTGEEVKFPE